MDPIFLIGIALLGAGALGGGVSSEGSGWWTKKTDALAKKRGLKTGWVEGHFDLRRLPNYHQSAWRRWPSHQAYFEEVWRSWKRTLPISAFMVAFAHCVKAQGWGKEGTKSRIPDHNNLGAWASSPQCLDGKVDFFVARDPAIGGQAFRYFHDWDGMLDYYLSRFGARSYLMSHFGADKSPDEITERQVQAYMTYIKKWLSSKTDPQKFGSQMYSFIKRFRGREFKSIWS